VHILNHIKEAVLLTKKAFQESIGAGRQIKFYHLHGF